MWWIIPWTTLYFFQELTPVKTHGACTGVNTIVSCVLLAWCYMFCHDMWCHQGWEHDMPWHGKAHGKHDIHDKYNKHDTWQVWQEWHMTSMTSMWYMTSMTYMTYLTLLPNPPKSQHQKSYGIIDSKIFHILYTYISLSLSLSVLFMQRSLCNTL
jgi:hypothetical protein